LIQYHQRLFNSYAQISLLFIQLLYFNCLSTKNATQPQ
jgi:hypothetical protein